MTSIITRFQSIEGSHIEKFVHKQEKNTPKENPYVMNLLFLEETQNKKQTIETLPPPN